MVSDIGGEYGRSPYRSRRVDFTKTGLTDRELRDLGDRALGDRDRRMCGDGERDLDDLGE